MAPRRIHLDEHPVAVVLLLLGFFLALFGTYWDDAWHTVEGRDSFLSPPHVALYAGVLIAGGGLGGWAAVSVRTLGPRRALSDPALSLALLGVAVTLASAPIDNGWHLAFGRDAVIWSPPHMLGLAGMFAIAAATTLELSRSSSRLAVYATPVAAAGMLAAAAIGVLEYETDVPQFSDAFYLPVLAAGAAFALALARRALRRELGASLTAAIQAVCLAMVALLLIAGELPAPLLPALVVPALALDLCARAELGRTLSAAAFVVALFVVYVPYLNLLKSDLYIDVGDVMFGVPAAFLGVWLSLAAAGWRRRPAGRAGTVIAQATMCILVLSMAVSGTALGHDPGQGEEAGAARVSAVTDGSTARITVEPRSDCDGLSPLRTVARRAGRTVTGGLSRVADCRFAGSIDLPTRGRWFLYAELGRAAETLETWIPVRSGETASVTEGRALYVRSETSSTWVKTAGGGAMYLLVIGLLFAIGRMFERSANEGSGA